MKGKREGLRETEKLHGSREREREPLDGRINVRKVVLTKEAS